MTLLLLDLKKASAVAAHGFTVRSSRSGPGSRGGKVIGTTTSGLPVYAHGPLASAHYTKQDHVDAAHSHRAMAALSDGDKRHHHLWMAGYHSHRSEGMSKGQNLHAGEPNIQPRAAHIVEKPKEATVVGRDKEGSKRPFKREQYKDNNAEKPPSPDLQAIGKSKTDGNPSQPDDAPPQYANQIRGQVLAQKMKEEINLSVKIPTAIEKAGNSQHKKERVHLKARMNIKKARNSMGAASDVLDDFLHKAGSGEGSHGGKIIGHTKSGKPIYATTSSNYRSANFQNRDDRTGSPKAEAARATRQRNTVMEEHPHFTAQDHADAAEAHLKNANGNNNVNRGRIISNAHKAASDHLRPKGSKGAFGSTQSGKPIHGPEKSELKGAIDRKHSFETQVSDATEAAGNMKGWSRQDHIDASEAHRQKANEGNYENNEFHTVAKEAHSNQADKMKDASTEKSMTGSDVLGDYMEKSGGGAGSRGGRVIGHTKSGKPIYGNAHQSYSKISGKEKHYDDITVKRGHPEYTAQDHKDAAAAHMGAISQSEINSRTSHKRAGLSPVDNKRMSIHNAHVRAANKMETEKSMTGSDVLNDFLSKSAGGTTVKDCADFDESYAGKTADGSEAGGVFPNKNQKVSAEQDDSKLTTYPADAGDEITTGFVRNPENVDAFTGAPDDMHTGELPVVKEEVWNSEDAIRTDGSGKPKAFEKGEDGNTMTRFGMVEYVNRGADARAAAIAKGGDFYIGGSPQLCNPMAQTMCKSCNSAMPQFLTACPCCGNGTSLTKCFGATDSSMATEAVLAAPQSFQNFRPGGLTIPK